MTESWNRDDVWARELMNILSGLKSVPDTFGFG